MVKNAPARWALSLALLSSLPSLACKREEVTHARVAKQPAAPAAPAGRPAPSGMQGDVPPPPAPKSGLRWSLPKGWTESREGGMRFATLKPPTPGRVDVSVVVLPGPAGGELANVNRWRGQIGLAPIDEAALASARKTVKAKAGTVSVYDFSSEGQQKSRMIAGLLEADGNSWFLKMVGDAEPVSSTRADFLGILESLRFE